MKIGALKVETIYGVDGEHRTPYLTRAQIGRYRLHVFHRGDADPDPHDHPWSFSTLPLTSYVEEVLVLGIEPGTWSMHRRVVKAFEVHRRGSHFKHRVIGRWTGSGTETDDRRIVTLVRVGTELRAWGFWKLCADGLRRFVPWRRYVFEGGNSSSCEGETL